MPLRGALQSELMLSSVNLDGLSADDIVNLLNISHTLPNAFDIPSLGETSESMDDTQPFDIEHAIDYGQHSTINPALLNTMSEPFDMRSSGHIAPFEMMPGESVGPDDRAL
jgi:hypothetical protein